MQKINPLYQGWETFCLTARQRKHEYDSKKGHQWTFSGPTNGLLYIYISVRVNHPEVEGSLTVNYTAVITIYTTGSQSWSEFIFDHPISKPYSTEAATANQALLMPFRLISVGFVSPEKSRIFIPPYLTIKSHCIPLNPVRSHCMNPFC